MSRPAVNFQMARKRNESKGREQMESETARKQSDKLTHDIMLSFTCKLVATQIQLYQVDQVAQARGDLACNTHETSTTVQNNN